MSLKFLTAGENDAGQRIDKFLLKCYPKLSKSLLYKSIRKKDIRLNGKRISGNEIINKNDEIRVFLPDDILENTKSLKKAVYSPNMPDVIFEDENIIVIYKPKGIETQPSSSGDTDTCYSRLNAYLDVNNMHEMSFRPAFVQRLDKNTDGLITAAKNAEALRELASLVKEHNLKKEYLCIALGKFAKRDAAIINYIDSGSKGNLVKVEKIKKDGYRKCITKYRVIKTSKDLNLCKVYLLTGRKHQIRASFADIGNPILGDPKYGDAALNKKYNKKSQMLTAVKLKFNVSEGMLLYYLNGVEICLPEKYLYEYEIIENI